MSEPTLLVCPECQDSTVDQRSSGLYLCHRRCGWTSWDPPTALRPQVLRASLAPALRKALAPRVPDELARQAAALAPLLRPAPPDDDTSD